ncbi:MAG: hypothetical protein EZS28_044609, partial [Streblomastix strix]
MPHLQEKAIRGEYKDEANLMQDLMKVMCYTTAKDGSALYMVKQWDSTTEINTISYIIKFYSKNVNEFFFFQGLKYNVLEQVDMNVIEQFLSLVKDTIAADDPIIYDYILNWLAWIVRKIAEKTGVAL